MKEKLIWTVKHVMIFAALYFLSAVIVEALVIVGFGALGYDFLHGEAPEGYWVEQLPLYGSVMFLILTLIYVKCIAKKKLADIKLVLSAKALPQSIAGLFAGGLTVGAAVLIMTATGDYRFAGYQGLSPAAFITLGVFCIQGAAEEVMSRGFLQNFLERKIPRWAAILITALAFTAPHLMSMDDNALVKLISIGNLLLVSVLFSLLMVRWNSLWVAIGFHVGWNYCVSYLFGLQLSGLEPGNNLLMFETASGRTWLHGGDYGLEAGVIVTLLLISLNLVVYLTGRRALTRGEVS